MKAWKMVNLKDASIVARGGLKIGTFDEYKVIENGRSDQFDGSVLFGIDNMDSTNADQRQRIADLGLVSMGASGHMKITSSLFVRESAPAHLFCMSEVGCTHDDTPDVPKAIFEISDIDLLGGLLFSILSRRVAGPIRLDRVRYEPRMFHYMDPAHPVPDPFVKDEAFAPEQEIRLHFADRWLARPNTVIFMEPDVLVASLLTQVSP